VEEVVPAIQPTLHFSGKMAYINIDTLDENFESGDTINIKILKEKNLIPLAAKQIKVLARSDKPLEKAFIVETQGISQKAEIAIRCAGGKVIIAAPNDGVKKK
jgi:ribosomal protein L15